MKKMNTEFSLILSVIFLSFLIFNAQLANQNNNNLPVFSDRNELTFMKVYLDILYSNYPEEIAKNKRTVL